MAGDSKVRGRLTIASLVIGDVFFLVGITLLISGAIFDCTWKIHRVYYGPDPRCVGMYASGGVLLGVGAILLCIGGVMYYKNRRSGGRMPAQPAPPMGMYPVPMMGASVPAMGGHPAHMMGAYPPPAVIGQPAPGYSGTFYPSPVAYGAYPGQGGVAAYPQNQIPSNQMDQNGSQPAQEIQQPQ